MFSKQTLWVACEQPFVEVLDNQLLLIEQVKCPKCCWKSEAVVQLSSVKMKFCKTSQISQERI